MASVLNFPTPLPDETITSLVTRYHQISGGVGVRRTLTDLFGSVTRSYASDLPCYLSRLEASSGFGGLADNHTLLPYFEPFLSPGIARRARKLMQSAQSEGLKMTLGITAAGFERFRVRQYCPRCVAVDVSVNGVSYWHIGHQATGVHVCPVHHCSLQRVLSDPRLGYFNQFFLPSDVIRLRGRGETESAPAAYFCRLAKLADIVDWGRSHPRAISSLLQARYLFFVLDRAGYISRGRVRAGMLAEHFLEATELYPPRDEFRRLFELHGEKVVWPFNLLRARASSHHPIFFYVFLNSFGVDLQCLIQDYAESVKFCPAPLLKAVCRASPAPHSELVARRQSFASSYATGPAKKARNYTWLYRHDRAWLRNYISCHAKRLAVNHNTDWGGRDRELVARLSRALDDLYALPGRPVLISLAALCRVLSVPPDAFRQQRKLPRSTAFIKACLESRHDHQLRKLHWAARFLAGTNVNITRSSLFRQANIRVLHLAESEVASIIVGATGIHSGHEIV
ncbi:TniQ family protein [Pseudomonas putida]|uniref:TnsD family Tn7-like transposition protein n=1 Tax=Pseudomonas TaxID=286 RepID=UPI001A900A35|nr:TniQ family protein [Pseudomonas putida]HEN8710205.1 TniQ family protein [Pseudomonas putida]HEN8715502.1 TniQ family protein [Pseudomonas putida]